MIVRDSVTSELVLDGRGQAVLAAIIKEHLVTGEPVGSRTIAERCAQTTAWSPATIRNTMAELEDAELVEQPHTSAGRVPTDKGYRYFVDHLMQNESRLSRQDLAAVNRFLQSTPPGGTDASRLMERVSHLLSQLSVNIGIVVAPPLTGNAIQHIEFVRLSEDRALVVMVFAFNIVQNKIIRLDEPLTQAELERAARYLNHDFSGKSLLAIRAEILQLLRDEKQLYDELINHAMLLTERSLEGEEEAAGDVFVDGTSNILTKPDFTDLRRLSELLRTLEAKTRLVEILNECIVQDRSPLLASLLPERSDVRVRIGRENSSPAMQNCTLITSSYRVGAGAATGTLGIVAPMRIEYARMMAVVNYVARLVERSLCEDSAA
jgi:heat-inducible transcriptional repressor